ncbi:thiamine monophosphate synthase [Methylobacterium indicum]|uniref:thiamine phosphate synthase n=1 Tax=Methylobacterium indicum TaxID=1775910 RepID=UPI0007343676|nr:thiamine phosphate synthase [Methylobacterium indicum]KTS24945.1 thiamine monophosphate synthase [Methylobacterium indicum]KTS42262.1 thiamine monophosphate synthase [Methylobacterium indicum]KTS54107.1 thiamine monophosphate synthase [Methylobacterium indicum]
MSLPARLLIVTDRHGCPEPLETRVAACLAAGARWIWLRDRDLPAPERAALAENLAAQVARVGGALTIGRDVELAAQVGAAGVQLGDAAAVAPARVRLGRGALLGVSAHSLAEVRAAREAGADYVTLSPIFLTASKPGYGPALGLAALGKAAALMPVVALGGIDPTTAPSCRAAGAATVAVMGAVMRASAVAARIQALT